MIGRFDLTIGPHSFPSTALYEVNYLPPSTPATLHPAGSQGGTPQPQLSFLESLRRDPTIYPGHVNAISQELASNPRLNHLLSLVNQGKATKADTDEIYALVKNMAAPEIPPEHKAISASPSSDPPVKPFDIVVEFQERPTDRLILTRGPAIIEVESAPSVANYGKLLMRLVLPTENNEPSKPNAVVTYMHWTKTTLSMQDVFLRWIGGEEKMAENKKILADLVRICLGLHTVRLTR